MPISKKRTDIKRAPQRPGLAKPAASRSQAKTSRKATKPKKAKSPKALTVVELFAGVGGFRVGLEKVMKGKAFKVVWSNQFEPGSRMQWASWVYEQLWGKDDESKHSNKLIEDAIAAGEVPVKFDVLVGGFPCQDYSVAKPNNQSKGIEGRKGVLWWSIYQIAEQSRPPYLILENVDRLVKSPAKQRGRDFAIMLRCLQTLGYHVEWRVINAAEYGMPQRRRRVFIVGYHSSTPIGKSMAKKSPNDVIRYDGLLANAFKCQSHKPGKSGDDEPEAPPRKPTSRLAAGQAELNLFGEKDIQPIVLSQEPHELTDTFNLGNSVHTPFLSAGFSLAHGDRAEVYTAQVYSAHKGKPQRLGDLLVPAHKVDKEFAIDASALDSWIYQKGGKEESRANYLTTLSHIVKGFSDRGVKVELDKKQKSSWTKQLSAYWAQHMHGGPGLEFVEQHTGQKLHVPHAEIEQTRFEYEFKEGPLPMPDPLDRPMRTIITSEGGSSPSRFKHVICTICAENWAKGKKLRGAHDCLGDRKLRRLTPVELERGNMFKPNHTKYARVPGAKKPVEVDARMRAFFMGNALVCGLVEKIGGVLNQARGRK